MWELCKKSKFEGLSTDKYDWQRRNFAPNDPKKNKIQYFVHFKFLPGVLRIRMFNLHRDFWLLNGHLSDWKCWRAASLFQHHTNSICEFMRSLGITGQIKEAFFLTSATVEVLLFFLRLRALYTSYVKLYVLSKSKDVGRGLRRTILWIIGAAHPLTPCQFRNADSSITLQWFSAIPRLVF